MGKKSIFGGISTTVCSSFSQCPVDSTMQSFLHRNVDVLSLNDIVMLFLNTCYEPCDGNDVNCVDVHKHFLHDVGSGFPFCSLRTFRQVVEDWMRTQNQSKLVGHEPMQMIYTRRTGGARAFACLNMRVRSDQTWDKTVALGWARHIMKTKAKRKADSMSARYLAKKQESRTVEARVKATASYKQKQEREQGYIVALMVGNDVFLGYVVGLHTPATVLDRLKSVHNISARIIARAATSEANFHAVLYALNGTRMSFDDERMSTDNAFSGPYILSSDEMKQIFAWAANTALPKLQFSRLSSPITRVAVVHQTQLDWEQHVRDANSMSTSTETVVCSVVGRDDELQFEIGGVRATALLTRRGRVRVHLYQLCSAILGHAGIFKIRALLRDSPHFAAYIDETAEFPADIYTAGVPFAGSSHLCVTAENTQYVLWGLLCDVWDPCAITCTTASIVAEITVIDAARRTPVNECIGVINDEIKRVTKRATSSFLCGGRVDL